MVWIILTIVAWALTIVLAIGVIILLVLVHHVKNQNAAWPKELELHKSDIERKLDIFRDGLWKMTWEKFDRESQTYQQQRGTPLASKKNDGKAL